MTRHCILTFCLFLALLTPAWAQKWTNFTAKNSGITGNNVLALATDARTDALWVGTSQGLSKLQDGNWTNYADFNEKLKNQFINSLVVQGNTLWIGTDDYGIIELNGTRWYEHAAETHRLNMKYIRSIAIDHAGVKWIGVTLSGFVRYDGVDWNKYTASDSQLLSDFILCVVIDRRDHKWIGTNDGLCYFDDNRWTSYTTANSRLPHNICLSIAIDKNNVKWVGTLEGLCRIDGDDWQIFNIDNCPLPGNQVNALAFDSKGLLWMATDGGVAVFDGLDRWDTFRAGDQLPKVMCQNITIDAHDNVWVGTDGRGLFRLSDYVMPTNEELAAIARLADDSADGQPTATTPTKSKGKNTTTKGRNTKADADTSASATDDRIRLTPDLQAGTLTLTFSAPEADIIFLNAKGDKVRTVPRYRPGTPINIAKMRKGNYTVRVKTATTSRSVKFTLK